MYGNREVEEYAVIFFAPSGSKRSTPAGSGFPKRLRSTRRAGVTRSSARPTGPCCRENSATFLQVNTHLDHISEPARVEGNSLILRRTEETRKNHGDLPTIITGDFNCRPGTRPYRVFIEDGFVDTFLAAGNEEDEGAYTFHAFKGAQFTPEDTDKLTGRIDWVLVRDDAGR
ncbi:MAG TPA: endonuclease/exonuclease/phosphatase family protein [Rubrobacter sp.]|nr:endonuclease/exonuclease/phosphatase family protein [Rubrobacter sp.]